VRNELTYLLTGGGAALSPTHRLNINLSLATTSLIVDPTTARPEFEIVGLTAAYKLSELASAKQVLDGTATQGVPYDIPGQQQRFAMLRAQRDAQSNAAKVIAAQIRTRLAAYFAAGS
jgi:LPS-assembly lipoprotein